MVHAAVTILYVFLKLVAKNIQNFKLSKLKKKKKRGVEKKEGGRTP